MADFLNRTEGIAVSHNYVATVWREAGLKPWQTLLANFLCFDHLLGVSSLSRAALAS